MKVTWPLRCVICDSPAVAATALLGRFRKGQLRAMNTETQQVHAAVTYFVDRGMVEIDGGVLRVVNFGKRQDKMRPNQRRKAQDDEEEQRAA